MTLAVPGIRDFIMRAHAPTKQNTRQTASPRHLLFNITLFSWISIHSVFCVL